MSRNHLFSRRAALQLAGVAGISAVAWPRLSLAQDAELPELLFTATDYAFELSGEPAAGWTRITMDNQGMMDHHLMLMKLHDPGTVADFEAVLETPDFGAIFPLAASVGGSASGPGLSSTVVLDLQPGEYFAICVIPEEDGTPHYMLGMKLHFTVAEGEAAGEAPASDLNVELKEMQFAGLPSELPAGAQVWEVANTGEQLHEMLLLALNEGITSDFAIAMFTGGGATPEAEMAGMDMGEGTPESDMAGMDTGEATPEMEMGPPPFANVAGVAPMSPGFTNYLQLDLAAGDYVAICFVPDMATGMPHFMMGMIAGFTVA